ncbi:nucleoside triphosphate pyrophosphatase [Pectobacteriaceae bacterium CE70]|uniref:dTTP/UTP pyrophosphatase n=1 Tax=Serratia sp. (strain ATCC 39006) TaxID=104623 RepID=A0A2I5T1Q4_SERS3|nr:nucleoside triphosphate pyrophosphatase [Serratia sp. ATCC 39006]WJV62876.1 nucleoside triphosphate pyrophosphatase [Pectobacteriaceae bacterium C52]WJV67215.1 nucleoside triphosphate pyrophosphatase [Pectobacteriaceae bacterium CE70]WJY11197.1 nucleoside triphosphate pyrophosphatase [Pectobacteriaceae bacterium C80]AUG98489.1 septum formation inhibitor Maf [Serratia sp. ATCC 39006]AUH02804.1 septum formation inhibitor Maf [Serratia sp. ATCC 39006]
MVELYLASSSPRRRELLGMLDIPFATLSIDVVEQRQPNETAESYVNRLAQEKAIAGVAVAPLDLPVLGADTIVVLDGQILEKPRDEAQASDMLAALSGRHHQVMTALALADRQAIVSQCVIIDVVFRELSDQDIAHYVASGEPMDKAGAYGIQGKGGCFVRSIVGSYHAVVGLPLVETIELFNHFSALRKVRGTHDR